MGICDSRVTRFFNVEGSIMPCSKGTQVKIQSQRTFCNDLYQVIDHLVKGKNTKKETGSQRPPVSI